MRYHGAQFEHCSASTTNWMISEWGSERGRIETNGPENSRPLSRAAGRKEGRKDGNDVCSAWFMSFRKWFWKGADIHKQITRWQNGSSRTFKINRARYELVFVSRFKRREKQKPLRRCQHRDSVTHCVVPFCGNWVMLITRHFFTRNMDSVWLWRVFHFICCVRDSYNIIHPIFSNKWRIERIKQNLIFQI